MAQVEHDRILLYIKTIVGEDEPIYQNREKQNESPPLIIDIRLLGQLIRGVVHKRGVIIATGEQEAEAEDEGIADICCNLNRRAKCAQLVHGHGLADHLVGSDVNNCDREPMKKLSQNKRRN